MIRGGTGISTSSLASRWHHKTHAPTCSVESWTSFKLANVAVLVITDDKNGELLKLTPASHATRSKSIA